MRALHPSLLVLCSVALLACEQGNGPSEPEHRDDPPPISREAPDAGQSAIDAGTLDLPPIELSSFDANFIGVDASAVVDLGRDAGGPPPRLSDLRSAPKPPPAISGGTLAVDKAGTFAVIGDSDRDLIYVVDLTTAAVRKLTLPSGSEPGRVALEGTKAAHVALRGTGELAHVELATGAVQRSAVCSHPRGVAFDAAHARIVVACLDGQLVQLDAATRKVAARTTDLPNDLRDVIMGADRVEAVTRHRSAELLRLDADLHVQASVRPRNGTRFGGFGAGVLLAPSVTDNTKAAPAPGGSLGGVSAPAIAPVRPLTLSPALAWRALRAASGNVWMLHQQSQDDQVVISQAGGYGGFQNGPCSAITGGKVSEFGPDGSTARSMVIPLSGLSVDAALSPNGKWLAVASPGAYVRGNSTLQVYSTDGMQASEVPGDCRPPLGVNGGESQVTSIAYDDNNVLYTFSRDPAELTILLEPAPDQAGVTLTRKATIALDLSSVRDTGHDLFHADVGQGIACASCHGEALDDGHVWNFEKIGPRRTQNMRGGLLATAPFHWDGDMMSMGHLIDEVMTRRMGGFQVPAPYVQALGSWIDRQPALTLPARDEAAAARGKALFNAADTQCASCHSGAGFTNNESRNVGTGGTFQVPGLRGLALRAPYMHSGCAKTLEERFTPACGGGDQHGVTTNLSASQIADLVAYLKTL